MPCLFHCLHTLIKTYNVQPVRKKCVFRAGQSPDGGKNVSFYTRDLHQTQNGIAGKAKVMLKPHFSSIFYLDRRSAQKLGCGSCSHGTGHAHLALAADICSGYGGVVFCNVAHQASRSQCFEQTLLRGFFLVLKIKQDCRQHAA